MTGRTIAGSPLFHFSPPPSIGRLANFQLPLEFGSHTLSTCVGEDLFPRSRCVAP